MMLFTQDAIRTYPTQGRVTIDRGDCVNAPVWIIAGRQTEVESILKYVGAAFLAVDYLIDTRLSRIASTKIGDENALQTSDERIAAEQFHKLTLDWHAERGATSSITEMAMCKSYLSIIAMGPAVIPLILRKMEDEGDEPDMWFVALQALTHNDPVTDASRGDFKKMADSWLAWARRSGYVW
jgi:hypothetical protein